MKLKAYEAGKVIQTSLPSSAIRRRRVSRFLGFVLEALAAVFSHTKAAESVLTKNYEEHVNALLQYFELDFGEDRDRQTEFFKQVSPLTCF